MSVLELPILRLSIAGSAVCAAIVAPIDGRAHRLSSVRTENEG